MFRFVVIAVAIVVVAALPHFDHRDDPIRRSIHIRYIPTGRSASIRYDPTSRSPSIRYDPTYRDAPAEFTDDDMKDNYSKHDFEDSEHHEGTDDMKDNYNNDFEDSEDRNGYNTREQYQVQSDRGEHRQH
ncbi:uncharacterized protein LOC125028565 [Penaeus chinensis]|uniref:uncharacterized protein LOC125028565 n=1 Tax=Penaeus chinensis TaxID=139456 RepID=UPI001FB76E48|nr:uncharacterized protein LOC125028565 [Penaeus chinensis]